MANKIHFKHCGVPLVSYFENTPSKYGCKSIFTDDYTLRYVENCPNCSTNLDWGTICPNCNIKIFDWEGEGECYNCGKSS